MSGTDGAICIAVDVAYYNNFHKDLLSKYPHADQIEWCVANAIEIPIEEFLTYYLLHRRPTDVSYRNLAHQTYKAKLWLEDQIDFSSGTIVKSTMATELPNEIMEHVGESVGLSVVNRIFGLTEADWYKIPKRTGMGKLFDFGHSISSDGGSILQLETKGSCTDVVSEKTPGISEHRSNIERKKLDIAQREIDGTYPHPASYRVGTITAFGKTEGQMARCWLLDPDPEPSEFSPRKLRIVNRLRFLHRWISLISPTSRIATALANRLIDVELTSNPDDFSDQPLRDGSGQNMEAKSFVSDGVERPTFFLNKSVVADGPAGGIVGQAGPEEFFFFGIRGDLVDLAIQQNLDEILRYRAAQGRIEKSVSCTFSRSRFERLRIPVEIESRAVRRGQYYSFELSGNLIYSQGGLVFGVLRA